MSDFEKKVLEFKNKLDQTQDVRLVESIRSEIFGKNGFINQEFKRIGTLSADEKKNFASSINKAKQELQNIIRSKENEVLNKELNEKLEKEKIDVTLPEKEFKIGKEIAHGVPALWSPNSNCNKPVSVTLKSGNFGQADFFKRALQILRGKT